MRLGEVIDRKANQPNTMHRRGEMGRGAARRSPANSAFCNEAGTGRSRRAAACTQEAREEDRRGGGRWVEEGRRKGGAEAEGRAHRATYLVVAGGLACCGARAPRTCALPPRSHARTSPCAEPLGRRPSVSDPFGRRRPLPPGRIRPPRAGPAARTKRPPHLPLTRWWGSMPLLGQLASSLSLPLRLSRRQQDARAALDPGGPTFVL